MTTNSEAFCLGGLMSDRKQVDKFDALAVALLQALINFMGEYREAGESERRAALVLIRGGLNEQMSKASTERQEVLEGSADDSFDAEEA
jgi:hypothetical protein